MHLNDFTEIYKYRAYYEYMEGDVIMKYCNKNIMLVKKISLFACFLVLIFSFIGCSSKSSLVVKTPIRQISVPMATTALAEVDKLKPELIKISQLKIKPNYANNITVVTGTATNNNKTMCNFGFEVIYLNKDGTTFITQFIQVIGIKSGETKYFTDKIMDIDISKTTHKIKFGEFFTYTK